MGKVERLRRVSERGMPFVGLFVLWVCRRWSGGGESWREAWCTHLPMYMPMEEVLAAMYCVMSSGTTFLSPETSPT
jgi:hypothetical protein